jgi:hypothetical protein
MIKQGRVYISVPPLYCWGDSAKTYGWCNKVEEIPASAKDVHRFKGLGEMNNDQLYYFLVDKNTRNLIQIEYPSDVDEFNKILGTSDGKGDLLKTLGVIKNAPILETITTVVVEETPEIKIPEIKPVKKKVEKSVEKKSVVPTGKEQIWNLF